MDVLTLIPEPIARTHNIIAYKRDGDSLEVAMLDVDDLASIDSVRKKTGLKILPRLTDTESVKSTLLQYQKSLKDEFGDIISTEAGKIRIVAEGNKDLSGDDLKKMAEDLPIVRVVDTLLRHAVVQGASDIHIEPMEKEVLVRYRIDGILHDAMTLPSTAAAGIVARIKVLSSLKLDEKRLPQDGRFKMETEAERVSFRVSILPTFFGEKTVMRLLRETGEGFTLDVLGLHGENMERIHKALKQTTGIILISGPTGSGKTTTLYTMLDILNRPDVNISTIEDPIEYQMKRINQTQVNPAIGFTFANGLRSLVRQDPDIIMVGEIRDGETANIAIQAALTGHFVFSTLHTNNAAGTFPRLADLGADPKSFGSAVTVSMAQRLLRKLDPDKKKERPLTSEEKKMIAKVFEPLADTSLMPEKLETVWDASPANAEETGYKDRIGLYEAIFMDDELAHFLRDNPPENEIAKLTAKQGYLTLAQDGIMKALAGITSLSEVAATVDLPR